MQRCKLTVHHRHGYGQNGQHTLQALKCFDLNIFQMIAIFYVSMVLFNFPAQAIAFERFFYHFGDRILWRFCKQSAITPAFPFGDHQPQINEFFTGFVLHLDRPTLKILSDPFALSYFHRR